MRLRELLPYGRVAIQCHDSPDADSLAAGFGLYLYFEAMGKGKTEKGEDLKFFYGGRTAISKPSLKAMVADLGIPVEHLPGLTEWDGLLVTVDCQYGAGNVARVSAAEVAVIDHHIQEGVLPALCELRPWLGSCSTLVWSLLADEAFSVDVPLATALYYGLFADTGGFSEIRHPLDRDMWDTLSVDHAILRKLRRSNLSLDDLALASAALADFRYDAAGRFMVIAAPSCDANLLGFVSDFAMQVDGVDLAVAFSRGDDGLKFSVRTSVREHRASELAEWLADDMGSGGGHREKAGGYIVGRKFGLRDPDAYFVGRIGAYLENYGVVDCSGAAMRGAELDAAAMRTYRKLPVRLGFVPCRRLFDGRTALRIRMLEGDMDIVADGDTILMIGIKGEVYPMEPDKFLETYTPTGERFAPDLSYPPVVLNRDTGIRVALLEFAEACVGGGGTRVSAMLLERGVKVFTRWDPENYFRGDPGDRIVARAPDDCYIVTADVFGRLYIRDFSGEDVAADPRSVRVVKRGIPVPVYFAEEDGMLETREGAIAYRKGDALLTGPEHESWPVVRGRFEEIYDPVPGTRSGANGTYRKKNGIAAVALQVDEPFMVELSDDKGTLRGESGDWLLQYSPGEYGVVGRDIFEATYRRCP